MPPSVPFYVFWGSFSGVNRPGREDHSSASSAEFMDDWSYDSTTPIRLRGLDRNFFTCTFQAVFSFGFPVTILPHMCYMTHLLHHPPRFGHPSIIWRGTQIMQLFITQFPPSYCYSHPHKSNYSSPCSRNPWTYILSLKWQIKFYTHIRVTNGKNYNFVHLIHDAFRRRIKLSNNIICVKRKPTWCHLFYYLFNTHSMLNMFRPLIRPSSGVCD